MAEFLELTVLSVGSTVIQFPGQQGKSNRLTGALQGIVEGSSKLLEFGLNHYWLIWPGAFLLQLPAAKPKHIGLKETGTMVDFRHGDEVDRVLYIDLGIVHVNNVHRHLTDIDKLLTPIFLNHALYAGPRKYI